MYPLVQTKKSFLWTMAAAQAAENHGDERGLIAEMIQTRLLILGASKYSIICKYNWEQPFCFCKYQTYSHDPFNHLRWNTLYQ